MSPKLSLLFHIRKIFWRSPDNPASIIADTVIKRKSKKRKMPIIASLGGSWELYYSSLVFKLLVVLDLVTTLAPPNNGLVYLLLFLGLNLVELVGGPGMAMGPLFLVDGPSCSSKVYVWNIFVISLFYTYLRTTTTMCS